jgi:phage gp36-like protein
MVQYATEVEFLSQALPSEAFTGLPAGTIDKALQWASSYANSKIKKRYSLPLTSWGDDLRFAVCDIAALTLLRRRGFKPGSGANVAVTDADKAARAWLQEISEGTAELDNCVDSTPDLDEAGPLAQSDTSADFTFYVSADGTVGGQDPFGGCGCP